MESKSVHMAMKSDDRPKGKILVSGCLNGPPIRYNETNVVVESPVWNLWVSEGRLVPFCGELAAGFPVPRRPAEIVIGDSAKVISGEGSVGEDTGRDVTDEFLMGAERTVAHAKTNGCVVAVLTDGSPSCGSTYQYDGSFLGGTRPGTGVIAQLLMDNGIKVFPETQLEEADQYLRQLG